MEHVDGVGKGGRVRQRNHKGLGARKLRAESLETLYTQAWQGTLFLTVSSPFFSAFFLIQPPSSFFPISFSFFFIPAAPLSKGLGPQVYESLWPVFSPLIQFISALSLGRPSSCFRALHSTVKGKVCNEISSEPSPGDHYAPKSEEDGPRFRNLATCNRYFRTESIRLEERARKRKRKNATRCACMYDGGGIINPWSLLSLNNFVTWLEQTSSAAARLNYYWLSKT